MNYQKFKQAVLAAAAAQGITQYELYYQETESGSVSTFRHEVQEFTSSLEGGVCFRCLVNGRMGYASTERFSAEEAVALVRRAADNAAVLESDEPEFLGEGGKNYQTVRSAGYEMPHTDELIAKALAGQDALYGSDPAVVDGCQTQVMAETLTIAIANSNGLDLNYRNTVALAFMDTVVSDGTEMADEFNLKVGVLDSLDLTAMAAEATAAAKEKLVADVAPTGSYPVVFGPKAMSSLLRTFASAFSAENAQKGLSQLGGKEGNAVAAPVVTLIDDPFYPANPMPMPFDAEGTPTACKKVIENGVLNTLLYNLKTAAVAGCASTGNGSKASYGAKVSVSPFTLYLQPGPFTEAQLLAKAANGVYINELQGLHAGANPISGDFSLQSAGNLIENGEKTRYVKSFTVAGNFYRLLDQITAVADTVELPMATGSTAFGSPAVLVEGLTIAGK